MLRGTWSNRIVAASAVSGSVRKASAGCERRASCQPSARSRTSAWKSGPPPYQASMPCAANQKASRCCAQSAGGGVSVSESTVIAYAAKQSGTFYASPGLPLFARRAKSVGLGAPVRHEFAERDEAAVHPARPIVQLDRVDAAQLATRRLEDEDIVIVERFGAALRPVDPIGAAEDRKSTRLNSSH